MKAGQRAVYFRFAVWRERLYSALAWCGIYVKAWEGEDAACPYASVIGRWVSQAIDDAGEDSMFFEIEPEWISEAVHRQVAHDRATELLNKVGRP